MGLWLDGFWVVSGVMLFKKVLLGRVGKVLIMEFVF